jgi:undecaprenyl-diphosphatase
VSLLIALILGIVEGLTEYLPVSSTGHLLLVSRWLRLPPGPIDSFDIVIQFGAILAVVVHYRTVLATHARGLLRRKPQSLTLLTHLAVGFLPMAIIGFLFRKIIKHYLFNPVSILSALIVGGLVMLVVPTRSMKDSATTTELSQMTTRQALIVGLGQCLALIPGSSRSMSTILAGSFAGLSIPLAAEFSFLLGLPTLGAACLYEGLKERHALAQIGVLPIAVGFVTSFVVAWAVVAMFIRYLQTRGLAPFGVYRIVLGAVDSACAGSRGAT